jgi:hypothetical protein
MQDRTPINLLFDDARRLSEVLQERGEISLDIATKSHLSKALLLSIASWFEFRLTSTVLKFAEIHSSNHPAMVSIIRIKAISRQYHTWFKWDRCDAGPFYALFGECGSVLKRAVAADPDIAKGQSAFLQLGDLRNQLVHENFATFPLTKTAEDIFADYEAAEHYMSWIEAKLVCPQFGRP